MNNQHRKPSRVVLVGGWVQYRCRSRWNTGKREKSRPSVEEQEEEGGIRINFEIRCRRKGRKNVINKYKSETFGFLGWRQFFFLFLSLSSSFMSSWGNRAKPAHIASLVAGKSEARSLPKASSFLARSARIQAPLLPQSRRVSAAAAVRGSDASSRAPHEMTGVGRGLDKSCCCSGVACGAGLSAGVLLMK